MENLYNAECLEIRRKLSLRSNYQSYNPGSRNMGLIYQIWEFNNWILDRIRHIQRI